MLREDPVGSVGSSDGGRSVILADGRGRGVAVVGVVLPAEAAFGPVGSEEEGALEMGRREAGRGFLTAEEKRARPASILTAGTREEADPFEVPPPSSGKSSGGGVRGVLLFGREGPLVAVSGEVDSSMLAMALDSA